MTDFTKVDRDFDELQVSYMSPEVDGLVIREELGLDDETEKIIKAFWHTKLEEAVREEREDIKERIELWMSTHSKLDKTFSTDDFIKYIIQNEKTKYRIYKRMESHI